MTAREVIARALQIIRVSGQGQAIAAVDEQDALDALNIMLRGWKLHDIDIWTVAVATEADLTENDSLVTPNSMDEAVAYQLATRIAANYATQLGQVTQALADGHWNALKAFYLSNGFVAVTLDKGIQNMPNQIKGYWRA